MRFKTTQAALAMAAALGFALSAGAQMMPQTTSPSSSPSTSTSAGGAADFGTLDADHDGMVTKKEATKNKDLGKKFSKLDANKDGKLDTAEFAQFEASGSIGESTPKP